MAKSDEKAGCTGVFKNVGPGVADISSTDETPPKTGKSYLVKCAGEQ